VRTMNTDAHADRLGTYVRPLSATTHAGWIGGRSAPSLRRVVPISAKNS
jgi:hypothetical protein